MFTRRSATFVLFALLGLASVSAQTAQAQRSPVPMKVFTDTHFGYTLSYPATWHVVPSTNLGIMVAAPDSAARLSATAIDAGLSVAQLRRVVDVTIGELSKTAKIIRTSRMIHGVTFQVGQTTTTISHGIKETAIVLAASRHQRTYLFFGLVGLGEPAAHLVNPRAQQEIGQIQASFASITIAQ